MISEWRCLAVRLSTLLIGLVGLSNAAQAVPPLVTGDVPTADRGHVEWYLGTRYQKTGDIERQVPFTELVYGLFSRQELTFEIPYLSLEGERGFGDIVLGTKVLVVKEQTIWPGVAGSFEWKLKNGNHRRGLGSGAMDYDFRFRSQKTWGRFTGLANVGYTFVGEPTDNGVRQKRHNVVFTAFAQEYELTPKAGLLSEIYWKTNEEPGSPNRLAADVGWKYHVLPAVTMHAAIGRSLREGHRGGPELRAYVGMKIEFPIGKES